MPKRLNSNDSFTDSTAIFLGEFPKFELFLNFNTYLTDTRFKGLKELPSGLNLIQFGQVGGVNRDSVCFFSEDVQVFQYSKDDETFYMSHDPLFIER
jgi:hypothetical protein